MGMNLKILPAYGGQADFCLDMLELDRDYNVFQQVEEIQKSKGRDCQRNGVKFYSDRGLTNHNETAYGSKLQSVPAGDLKKVDLFEASHKNTGIFAFINALPDEWELYLYWH